MQGPRAMFWRLLKKPLEPADGILLPFLLFGLIVAPVGILLTRRRRKKQSAREAPDVDIADISAYRPQRPKPASIR